MEAEKAIHLSSCILATRVGYIKSAKCKLGNVNDRTEPNIPYSGKLAYFFPNIDLQKELWSCPLRKYTGHLLCSPHDGCKRLLSSVTGIV